MDFSDLVEAEVFITDTRNLKTVNEVYNELVKSPATPTNIGLDLMSADLLVEIASFGKKMTLAITNHEAFYAHY